MSQRSHADGILPDFEAFVRLRGRRLLQFAVLMTGDRGHAEDLLQVALLRLSRRWDSAQPHPEAYVRVTLVNLVKDRARSFSRRPPETFPPPVDAVAVPDRDDEVIDRHVLVQALGQLTPVQRAVIVLRFWEDQSVGETARSLGIPAGTVKSHTSRGLERLKAVLGDAGADRNAMEAPRAHH